jgi:L-amino acid N-acyltransferase YncA
MSKQKVKFGKTNVTLQLGEHGFYVSKANKDGIVYIIAPSTAETGNGKTYALHLGEEDNYDEVIETTIAMIKELEKE